MIFIYYYSKNSKNTTHKIKYPYIYYHFYDLRALDPKIKFTI